MIVKRSLDSQNNHNLDSQVSVEDSVILPIGGSYKRIENVSLPAYISGGLATHTTTNVDSTLQVDHLPTVSSQTLGPMDMVCESLPFTSGPVTSGAHGMDRIRQDKHVVRCWRYNGV